MRARAISRNNLAHSLTSAKRFEEAEHEYAKAIALEPNLPFIRVTWIRILHALGRHKEVVAQREMLVEQHPTHAMFRMLLGISLESELDSDGATVEHNLALSLEPNNFEMQREYRNFLIRQNKHEEAFEKWSQWAKSSVESHDALYGLAELSLFLNRNEDFENCRNELLDRFEYSSDRHIVERSARTCLLAGTTDAQLARILKMSESVTKLDRQSAGVTYPFFQFLKALILFRQGNHHEAESILLGDAANVLRPAPNFIVSMIRLERGDVDVAKNTFNEAVRSYDWSPNKAMDQDAWIRHVLRRETSEAFRTRAITLSFE